MLERGRYALRHAWHIGCSASVAGPSYDPEGAKKLLPQVFSTIDQAVKKGTIHKNTGSRYKSRLSRQVGELTVTPAK